MMAETNTRQQIEIKKKRLQALKEQRTKRHLPYSKSEVDALVDSLIGPHADRTNENQPIKSKSDKPIVVEAVVKIPKKQLSLQEFVVLDIPPIVPIAWRRKK